MKKMMKLLPLALAALLTLGFTSCDTEEYYYDEYEYNDYSDGDLYEMANTLRGRWSGRTAARFYDENGVLRQEVYDTDIDFDLYNANAYNGRGRQLDYLEGQLVYDRTFTWRIERGSGNIIMVYDGENGKKFQMVIKYNDLKLDDHTFSGVQVGDGETDEFSYQRYTYAKKAVYEME